MWLLLAAVSHFSMIGYPVATQDSQTMGVDLQRYAEHCESIPLDAGHRACLVADASGAELWIGLADKAGQPSEFVTMNPALRGSSRTKIVVTGTSSAAEWRPFETVVQADFAEAKTPMLFEIADPRETSRFKSGAALVVDITAFPRELEFYDSEKAYDESQRGAKVRFAPNHFIPSGMFTDGKSGDGPLRSLEGFKRVSLRPKERKTVEFKLKPEQIARVGVDGRRRLEPGRVDLTVGNLPVSIRVTGAAKVLD